MCKLPNRFPPSLGFFTPLEYVLQAVKPNKLHLRNCCVNCYLIWRFLRKFQKAWFEKTNGRHHDSQKKLNKTDCLRTSPILLMRSSMPLFIVQHTTSLCTFLRSSPSTVQHRASLCMFRSTYKPIFASCNVLSKKGSWRESYCGIFVTSISLGRCDNANVLAKADSIWDCNCYPRTAT